MMRTRNLIAPIFYLAILAPADPVHAQNAPGNWVVKKVYYGNLNKRSEIVDRGLTERAAREKARQLNKETPVSAGIYYSADKASSDNPAPQFPNPVPLPPGVLPGITPPLPSPSPNPTPQPSPKTKLLDLVGYENLGGYGRLRFRFMPGDKAVMFDKDGQTMGTWSMSGNQVRLAFYKGTVVYTGTIRGNRISGAATNGRRNWSFSVSPQSTARPPVPSRKSTQSRPPYRAYMVRRGQRIRFRQHSTLGPALSQANRYRNTLGATEVGVEDVNGRIVRRVR